MSVYDLTGRKALVTGGAQGLGAGMAEALAKAGAGVVIADVQEDAGKKTADSLRDSGATAGFVYLDVTEDESWDAAISSTISELGGLDILVNNAAVSGGDLDRMHAVNYLGVIALIRAAVPVLRDDGRIINVGSGIGSRVGVPGVADYAATKAGIVGYTRGVARDLAGRGITVNVVQAGLMDTDMTPPDPAVLALLVSSLAIQRVSDPREVAEVIRFLATPEAGYVTGAVLDANGGYTA